MYYKQYSVHMVQIVSYFLCKHETLSLRWFNVGPLYVTLAHFKPIQAQRFVLVGFFSVVILLTLHALPAPYNNPCGAELFVSIFHSFEAGIAKANSSFN